MDATVFKRWFLEVFVPFFCARTEHHVNRILDNMGGHDGISHPNITVIELPLNTTAIY